MGITDVLALLGGLALFLYGMQMMSTGLEAAAGNRMKSILEKLTSNRVKGVLVGAAITAVIQSSSATTVMVVGFVNSGFDDIKTGGMGDHGEPISERRLQVSSLLLISERSLRFLRSQA